jgi:hypothetical protein
VRVIGCDSIFILDLNPDKTATLHVNNMEFPVFVLFLLTVLVQGTLQADWSSDFDNDFQQFGT